MKQSSLFIILTTTPHRHAASTMRDAVFIGLNSSPSLQTIIHLSHYFICFCLKFLLLLSSCRLSRPTKSIQNHTSPADRFHTIFVVFTKPAASSRFRLHTDVHVLLKRCDPRETPRPVCLCVSDGVSSLFMTETCI